jgi:hypothetical protein
MNRPCSRRRLDLAKVFITGFHLSQAERPHINSVVAQAASVQQYWQSFGSPLKCPTENQPSHGACLLGEDALLPTY